MPNKWAVKLHYFMSLRSNRVLRSYRMNTPNSTSKSSQRDLFAASFFSLVVVLTAIALIISGCGSRSTKPTGVKKPIVQQPELPADKSIAGTDKVKDSSDTAAADPSMECDTPNDESGNPEVRIGNQDDPRSFVTTLCRARHIRILLLALKGNWVERDATIAEEPDSDRRNSCFASKTWEGLYNVSKSQQFLIKPLEGVASTKSYLSFAPNGISGNIENLIGTPANPGMIKPMSEEVDFISPSRLIYEGTKLVHKMSTVPFVWGNVFDQPVQIENFFAEGLRVFLNEDCTVDKESSGTLFPAAIMGSSPETFVAPKVVMNLKNILPIDGDQITIEAAFHVINTVKSATGNETNFHVRHFVVKLDTGITDYNTLVNATALPKSSNLVVYLDHSYIVGNLDEYANSKTPKAYSGLIPTDTRTDYFRYFEKTNEDRVAELN